MGTLRILPLFWNQSRFRVRSSYPNGYALAQGLLYETEDNEPRLEAYLSRHTGQS